MSDAPTTEIAPSKGKHIRGAHILYAMALLGSAVLLFGPFGVLVGFILTAMWSFVFYRESRPNSLCIVLMLAFICSCLFFVFAPSLSYRETSWHSTCKNNLKMIMLALHNYHDDYGSFPPAYVADENGRPMHSWLLLPYFDEQELYDAYRFDEPWDSEANRKLLLRTPYPYACPSHSNSLDGDGVTSYAAVVGPRSAFSGDRGRTLNEFPDRTWKTVTIVETDSDAIPWTEPRDIDLSAAVRLLGSTDPDAIGTHQYKEFFFEYLPYRQVALADGRVGSAPAGLDAEFARQLLTVDDGGPSGGPDVNPFASQRHRNLRIFNAFRFALFALLAVLPLTWVWLNPRPREKRPPAAA